jgi:hypothetical protein
VVVVPHLPLLLAGSLVVVRRSTHRQAVLCPLELDQVRGAARVHAAVRQLAVRATHIACVPLTFSQPHLTAFHLLYFLRSDLLAHGLPPLAHSSTLCLAHGDAVSDPTGLLMSHGKRTKSARISQLFWLETCISQPPTPELNFAIPCFCFGVCIHPNSHRHLCMLCECMHTGTPPCGWTSGLATGSGSWEPSTASRILSRCSW